MEQYERNRGVEMKQEALQREINRNMLVIDRSCFHKSEAEKLKLANAKMQWKRDKPSNM